MIETGRVLSVEEELLGSSVAADTAAGATELPVDSTEDFEEHGGTLQIVSGHNVQTIAYGVPDDEGSLLPLLSPLTAAVEEADEVSIPGAVKRYAAVALEDAPDEAIFALIPHSLIQRLPAGVRDLDDLDAVTIRETTPGDWVVDDVLGRELARVGIAQTDWRNGKGLYLAGGDPTAGEGFFGVGVISAEMVAENAGPESVNLPLGSSNTYRRIGRTGAGSGAVTVVTDFPAKVTLSGIASVLNTSGVDWNVRFYLVAVNADTDDEYVGRQGTQYCPGGNSSAHRQVTNERQFFFDASPDLPTRINFWWGFTRDAGTSALAQGSCQLRNLKMTLRVSYAPDVPIKKDGGADDTPGALEKAPEREPAWTSHAEMKESYLRLEENASLTEA